MSPGFNLNLDVVSIYIFSAKKSEANINCISIYNGLGQEIDIGRWSLSINLFENALIFPRWSYCRFSWNSRLYNRDDWRCAFQKENLAEYLLPLLFVLI